MRAHELVEKRLFRPPTGSVRDAALAAIDDASAQVMVDSVTMPDNPAIAMIVVGHLANMPTFLMDGGGGFAYDASGLPMQLGTKDAPFRIVVPAGTGDYHFVMYGHGLGGNQLDDAFDSDLAGIGTAKVAMRLYGWTGSRHPWPWLLKRVFAVDIEACPVPGCGGRMRLVEIATEPDGIARVMAALGDDDAARAPPRRPRPSPPGQLRLAFG